MLPSPPKVIDKSFAITCEHSCSIDSHITGFTLPVIIEDPGCTDGIINSPKPDLGPDPSHLISFAILDNETAKAFKFPETSIEQSCAD